MNVMVAMSGGVDSSVAAYLLKEKGYTVAGVTMRLAVHDASGEKQYFGEEAVSDAKRVCGQLGIEHHVVDISDKFIECVIDNFTGEYMRGRTPNPCVECNRNIKFGELFRYARDCGYEFFATGHYADIVRINDDYFIKKNIDETKDQSYFLYVVPKDILPHILFPISELKKEKVREIAREAGLSVAHKADSQDICFIQGNDYRDFIIKCASKDAAQKIKEGDFVDKTGKKLGRHRGIPFYTIGQRRGLGISADKPLYVVALDLPKNQVVLGYQDDLKMKELTAGHLNLFMDTLPENLTAKTRFRQKPVSCSAVVGDGELKIVFEQEIDAITVGQSVVLYSGDLLVGGGIIESGS